MSREFRQLLRVAGTSVDGTKKLTYGILRIKGVGPSYAVAIVRAAELRPESRLGDLSEGEVQKLEDVMRNPRSMGYRPASTIEERGLKMAATHI